MVDCIKKCYFACVKHRSSVNTLKAMDYIKTKAACNYFIEQARSEGRCITPMQAIKLVYFAHAYTLAILDRPLIDDHVEAWKFGAVIPSLYHSLKQFGSDPITAPILDKKKVDYTDWLMNSPEELAKEYPKAIFHTNFSKEEKEVMNSIWALYKDKDAFELSAIIHQPNTPWTQVWEEKGKYAHGAVISDDLIKDYYIRLINTADE